MTPMVAQTASVGKQYGLTDFGSQRRSACNHEAYDEEWSRPDQPTVFRPHRRACRSAIPSGSIDAYLDDVVTFNRGGQEVAWDVMNIDFHSPRPGRRYVASRLANANIDKPTNRPLPTNLLAKKLRTGSYADSKIEREGLALPREFRIERAFVLCLKTVKHADDRMLYHNSQPDLDLICLGHGDL